ncbi:IQ motif-containing protein H [Aulostomus maculatus]
MCDAFKTEDNLGAVLVQVQDDLRQLKCSLEKISISESRTLDLQALDNAIQKTEKAIRKHSEDYLKSVNKQLLVLPSIVDLQKKTFQIPKWKPVFESIPDLHRQKEDLSGASPGEKHKSALAMRLLCNTNHPNNRAIMHQKFGIPLPDVHKKSSHAIKHHKIITGPVVTFQTTEARNSRVIPKDDTETGVLSSKYRCHHQLKWEAEPALIHSRTGQECRPPWTSKTPPPSAASKSMDYQGMMQGSEGRIPQNSQKPPVETLVNISKFPFTILKGRINPEATDFCHFKQSFSSCWSRVVDTLEALEKLLRDFAVPLARVSGERLVEIGQGWENGWTRDPSVNSLLSVLENWEEVLDLVLKPGQRFKGEGGAEAAAVRIQSCWRAHQARTAYLRHRRHKWAAGIITISWLMHTQMRRVRKALQERRFRQLENYRSRVQHLAANWKHIQSSKRTIIHIPSLGYSQKRRRSLRGFDVLQNMQIGRLCDVRDQNVEVIYICPRHLEEDFMHYYNKLLKCDGASVGTETRTSSRRRYVILTPEAVDYFPTHNMCLSTLLKYSPHTLKRIKNLIQGKQAYIVGGVAHVDDLAVADELGVPVLGPEPDVAKLYSTKSGGRRIFAGAEVDVPPGRGDIYSLNQLYETLAELMTQHTDVQRWLFKMDSEHGGRGTAYCDVRHLSCYSWALREHQHCAAQLWNMTWTQESVQLRYLEEIPDWLARYARPVRTSCFPNWTCFLKTFLRQGGVVEAFPPSDCVTCLTVDLLLEPGGEVTMLSCGDQLHSSSQLEAVGSSIPQTAISPETLSSICTRVGRACLQRLIIGYVSVDLATFLNRSTMEQKVWAVDVDLTYSDQLAMTQMLLMMTGGTLNFCTGCLEVSLPTPEKSSQQKITAKPPVVHHYAVLGSHLFHSNLSMLYHNVFFKMCKAHGIGFNMKTKRGTVFALYDSSERCRIGMIAVSEDLQGALLTFARNLSVIHQEISSSKTQGETNFKELIKDIEDVLQMTAQNKLQALERRAAV